MCIYLDVCGLLQLTHCIVTETMVQHLLTLLEDTQVAKVLDYLHTQSSPATLLITHAIHTLKVCDTYGSYVCDYIHLLSLCIAITCLQYSPECTYTINSYL